MCVRGYNTRVVCWESAMKTLTSQATPAGCGVRTSTQHEREGQGNRDYTVLLLGWVVGACACMCLCQGFLQPPFHRSIGRVRPRYEGQLRTFL